MLQHTNYPLSQSHLAFDDVIVEQHLDLVERRQNANVRISAEKKVTTNVEHARLHLKTHAHPKLNAISVI